MGFEQKKRQLVRAEVRQFCKRCKWRCLIGRKALVLLHDVATGAPTIREGLSILGISRERRRSEDNTE